MTGWRSLFAFGVCLIGAFGAATAAGEDASVDLAQGWTAAQVRTWYTTSQGSRLLPTAWLRALEQPSSQAPFLDDAHIASFRYLPQPGALPVGFAEDAQDDRKLGATKLRWKEGQGPNEPWVGFTCAACHTAELRQGATTLRVQGGAGLADYQGFVAALNASLEATRDQPEKFARFADRVLGPSAGPADRARLATALKSLTDYQLKIAATNETTMRYGFGRLDAVGQILNKVALVANPTSPSANAPDAPVSYPMIWNTSQQSRVEWNGLAYNQPATLPNGSVLDVGALGRNIGEVIGVFGDVRVPGPSPFDLLYHSSVDTRGLIALEQQLMTLKPPRWPRELFPVDQTLAAEGRQIFSDRCVACHAALPRDDLTRRQRGAGDPRPLEDMGFFLSVDGKRAVDTDPWMACNAATNEAATGLLKGRQKEMLRLERFGDQAPVTQMLTAVVTGVIIETAPDLVRLGATGFKGTHPPALAKEPKLPAKRPLAGGPALPAGAEDYAKRRARCDAVALDRATYSEVGYKARPLNGVWSSGPYLHNGSVPTLYDMLLPAGERPTRFFIGSRDFDPAKVGPVVTARPGNDFEFRVRDDAGRIIEGNSNLGHDYDNASLTPRARQALLEYLKVIGE